ncbi:MAG: hypothetical protein AAF378_08370 [Cyanobacteria bacterium P01_A01_bin.84]
MLKRLLEFIKNFFRRLFGGKKNLPTNKVNTQHQPPLPLGDSDLEFLFTELLEGVNQARGQSWALKWLHNIEGRVTTERWLEWLDKFGQKLLSSSNPNNELGSRMVQLGELDVGAVGDRAYDIGMKLLTRNQSEPVWEYDGPDVLKNGGGRIVEESLIEGEVVQGNNQISEENLPEGEYQTVSLEELYEMIQEDENLRQMIAQQLEVETDDPELIMRKLMNQFNATN